MATPFPAGAEDAPIVPVCPRCERSTEVIPTFEKPLEWECARCDLRFAEGMAYL